ncbi:unnamed protein product [Paramecium pentaurelia]|uniref:Uncharacterized protein n=1 Tax=Paramecium pentaurelia TaxID=43138 RepID=A0A8S1VTD8_9CILI|nr:unnamed protein product [Paramecium pentaurelia]
MYLLDQQNQKVIFGIRDFYLYSIPCPNNCRNCKMTDTQEYMNVQICNFLQNFISKQTEICLIAMVGQSFKHLKVQQFINHLIAVVKVIYLDQWIWETKLGKKLSQNLITKSTYNICMQYFNKYLPLQHFGRGSQMVRQSIQSDMQPKITFFIFSRLIDNTRGDLIAQTSQLKFLHLKLIILRLENQVGSLNYQVIIKKCHPSCLYICKGPKESQCQNIQYPEYTLIANNLKLNTFSDDEDWQVVSTFEFSLPNECNNQALLGGYYILQGKYLLQSVYVLKTHIKIGI